MSAADELGRIGARLGGAGLHARALAAWAGTARVAALPARLDAMPRSPATTQAGAVLSLFVAGAAIERGQLGATAAEAIDALVAHRLVARDGDRVEARVAIVPIEQALLVCDRLDAPIERELVCWPDDSSHHLATAIPPGRYTDWLDLGCGSAFAALARPALAARIVAADLNPRAVRHAQLGAALSGMAHLKAAVADVGEMDERADLITCNAPIPDLPSLRGHVGGRLLPEIWRRAEAGFFERLWPAVARAVRPGGMIVVHAAEEAVLPALEGAPGERVVVTYTPESVRGFAVAWWRPDAPARYAAMRRALTPDRPHIDPRDREDALAR